MARDEDHAVNISVCITCWRGDVHLAPRCLEFFQRQTRLPDEIVVSANGIPPWRRRGYLDEFKELVSCDVKLVSTWKRLTPAGARNMGFPACRGDIIVFFDVDDLPHPEKIRFTEFIFTRHDLDLLAHDYLLKQPLAVFDNQPEVDCETVPVTSDVIVDPDPRSTNVLPLKPDASGHYDMHQAHVAVKRSVLDRIRFNESQTFFRREDGKFCQDALKAGYKLLYANCKLVNYL